MLDRHPGSQTQKVLWRILTNPTFEVVAAILVVALATWVVVETQMELRDTRNGLPILFGQK